MTSRTERPAALRVPAFARGPVLVLAAAVALLLTAVSGRYGYFGDELYFISAGRHLAWGYVDQPPALPLLAHVLDTLAPGSVAVLRIPATLATVAGLVLTALLTRECGGGRRAQLLAAGTFAVSPNFLANGHLLVTSTFDPAFWIAIIFCVVRWLRTRDDRLLLVAGVLTAVDLQVKFLIPIFWGVLVVAVLAVGPRTLLTRPALWVGGAIAVLTAAPTLVWQATHGWPQLAMSRAIAAESVYTNGMLGYVPFALVATGLVVGSVLAIHGIGVLLEDPARRFLGVTALGVTAAFLLTDGRIYYVAGLFPLLWAASAARIEQHPPARWWRWVPTWPALVLSAVYVAMFTSVLPLRPAAFYAGQPTQVTDLIRDEIGWEQAVPDVVAAWRAAPAGSVVVTTYYWTFAAVQHFAPEVPTFSPHRGAVWFATPPDDARSIVLVGDPRLYLPFFASARQVGVFDNDQNINNYTQGTPIYLLEGRTASWARIWPAVTMV